MSLTLTLPLPPNRGNARGHWRKIQRDKTAYYAAADIALYNQLGPRSPNWRPQRMRLTSTLFVWQPSDPDNSVSRLKWVIDSLVRYGLLYEDRGAWLELEMPKQVVDRKQQRIELTLTPVREG